MIERGNFHFYFPIATCILVSAVLWHCHGNANQHELSAKFAKRHAAATAPRHCAVASARKIRNEHREMRWRCRLQGVVNRGVHAEGALLGHHQIDEICKAFRRHRAGQVESRPQDRPVADIGAEARTIEDIEILASDPPPARTSSRSTPRWREMDSNPRSPVRRLTQTRSNGDVQHPCAAVGHARLAHPTIRDDDRSYPRSVIPGRDALACRDLVGLRRRTGDVIRFLWNGNGTLPALRPPLTRFSRG